LPNEIVDQLRGQHGDVEGLTGVDLALQQGGDAIANRNAVA
jgi:hypothetical protein